MDRLFIPISLPTVQEPAQSITKPLDDTHKAKKENRSDENERESDCRYRPRKVHTQARDEAAEQTSCANDTATEFYSSGQTLPEIMNQSETDATEDGDERDQPLCRLLAKECLEEILNVTH